MVQINFARKEIACKIVYYGPGQSGKTTNLEQLYKRTPSERRGTLTSLATNGDRTLFFDYLPLNLGKFKGLKIKFQLYTVPGQVYYNATRKLVLRGVDGVIFVADSRSEKMNDNIESLRNLEENLREYGLKTREIPLVLQYNKRDQPDAMDVVAMNSDLNTWDNPWFEAVAIDGKGILDCLKALAVKMVKSLEDQQVCLDESEVAEAVPVEEEEVPEISERRVRPPRQEQRENHSHSRTSLVFLLALLGILSAILYFQF